tara:strand:- start:716 stop:1000 length:285 start_codon:yes stop_codon:yes gene_type:complete
MNKKIDLINLKKKIDEFKKINEKKDMSTSSKKGMSFGFRIGIEIVAALVVGVSIGIIVDKYLNTKPFGLIIFFILGSLAGFLNVYRVMRRIEKE